MTQEQDPIKTRLFLSKYTKSFFTTYIYSPFETYKENSSKGRLFGVLSLSSKKEFECVKTLETLKSMLVNRFYSGDEGSIIDSLEFAIAHIKQELSSIVEKRRMELEKSLDLDCLIISIKDNVVYIASFGDNEIFLQREDKRNNLVMHLRDSLGRNQVRVASVLLEPEDKILLTTRDASNKILEMKLNSCLEEFDFEKLNKTSLKTDHVGMCLYAIGYHVTPPVVIIPEPVIVEPPKKKEPPSLYPGRPKIIREPEPIPVPEIPEVPKVKEPPSLYPNRPKRVIEEPVPEVVPPPQIPSEPQRKLTPHEILYGHRKLERDIPVEATVRPSVVDNSQILEVQQVPQLYREETKVAVNNFQKSSENRFSQNSPIDPKKKIYTEEPPITKTQKPLSEITIIVYLRKFWGVVVSISIAVYYFLKSKLDKSPRGQFETRSRRIPNFGSNKFHAGQEGEKKKVNMKIFVPVIVLLILFLGFFISNNMKVSQDKKARDDLVNSTSALIQQAKDLTTEADTYALTNKSKSREDIRLAELKLQEAEKNKLVEFNKQIDEVRKNSQIIVDKKIEKNIYLTDSNVVQEISSIYQNSTITGLIVISSKVYISLKDGKILEGQKSGSGYSFVNILPDTPKISSIDKLSKELDGNLIFYNLNEGLYRYNFADKSVKKVPNMSNAVMGNVGSMTALDLNGSKYLYFINQVTGQLFRSKKVNDGYADPEERIKAPEFTKVSSLAIDNKIWVVANSMLKRYFDGKDDKFTITPSKFDFTLTKISNVELQADQVLLSDDISKRVAIFKKSDILSQSTLEYIVSFVYRGTKDTSGFNPIVGMEVVDGNLYILDSKRLYMVSFVISSEYYVGVN